MILSYIFWWEANLPLGVVMQATMSPDETLMTGLLSQRAPSPSRKMIATARPRMGPGVAKRRGREGKPKPSGVAESRTSRPTVIVALRGGVSMGRDACGSERMLGNGLLHWRCFGPRFCTVLVPFFGRVPPLYRDYLRQNTSVCDGLPMSQSSRKMVSHKSIFAFRR